MTKRVCAQSGCGELLDPPHYRCDEHRREKDRARGTRQQRGYGAGHESLRSAYQKRMDAGEPFRCWRPACRRPIDPAAWTLGHCDTDRSRYHGPECPSCQYATSGRTTCPHESHAAS